MDNAAERFHSKPLKMIVSHASNLWMFLGGIKDGLDEAEDSMELKFKEDRMFEKIFATYDCI